MSEQITFIDKLTKVCNDFKTEAITEFDFKDEIGTLKLELDEMEEDFLSIEKPTTDEEDLNEAWEEADEGFFKLRDAFDEIALYFEDYYTAHLDNAITLATEGLEKMDLLITISKRVSL